MPLYLSRLVVGNCSKTTVRSSKSPQKLLPSNDDRQGVTIFNQSESMLYIDFGEIVSTSAFLVAIAPGGYWESPFPCVESVWGVWTRAQGQAQIREFS